LSYNYNYSIIISSFSLLTYLNRKEKQKATKTSNSKKNSKAKQKQKHKVTKSKQIRTESKILQPIRIKSAGPLYSKPYILLTYKIVRRDSSDRPMRVSTNQSSSI